MAFALIKCAIAQAVKPYGFEFALAIANKVGHPNGIRTRVTPVKGECPRPLDDRVKGLVTIHYTVPRFKLYHQEYSLPLTRRPVR